MVEKSIKAHEKIGEARFKEKFGNLPVIIKSLTMAKELEEDEERGEDLLTSTPMTKQW